MLREANRQHFTPAEVRFVASLTGALADGLRRAMLFGDAAGGDDSAGELLGDALCTPCSASMVT